jgi:hypothetical protein
MSILFTAFLAFGLLLGWIHDLWSESISYQFMVWSCILTSLVFGFSAELLVAAWRFKLPRVSRTRKAFLHIATNFVLAVGISLVVLVLLALPVLDSTRFAVLVVSVVLFEFLAVCTLASFIIARREHQSPIRSVFLKAFSNYALLNIASMVVGLAAGRLYLIIFYPGIG